MTARPDTCAPPRTSDAGFADRAIAEYLVEETRALPPDVGLDVAAVLRDAVAARARRKIGDAVLLVLLVAFLLPWLAILWLLTRGRHDAREARRGIERPDEHSQPEAA
jgi:hypothetical protein